MLNESDNANNIFKVIIPDNINSLWLKFELKLGNKSFKKSFISKQWILTDQSSSLIFSLGNMQKWKLIVTWNDWEKKQYDVEKWNIIKLN
jgi:hypothetical protein